jgi:recombination protein RecA
MAKVSGISKVISDLQEKYGKSLPDVNEAGIVKRLTLSSPKLNYIFGGGFPLGRVMELAGSESGGKSVLASYIGGQIQKSDGKKMVVYVDIECTFDKHYAEVVGLNCDEDFVLVRPLNGEQAFTIAEEMVKTGEVGLIIWDSTTTTGTTASIEDEYGKASFGAGAKLFSDGLRKLNPYLSRFGTSLILLTQMRAKMGFQSYGPPDTPSGGGYAPRFYSSWRARISKSEDILDKKEIIGNKIKVKNIKSKIGFPKRAIEMDLYYNSGFNSDSEYIEFMLQLGIIERKGGWYNSEDWGMKVQGSDKVLAWLYDHQDKFDEAKLQVNEIFTKYSVLDSSESEDEEEQGE